MASEIKQGLSPLWLSTCNNGAPEISSSAGGLAELDSLKGKTVVLLMIDSRENEADELTAFEALHRKMGHVYDQVIGFRGPQKLHEGLQNEILQTLLVLKNRNPKHIDILAYGTMCPHFREVMNQRVIDGTMIRGAFLFSRENSLDEDLGLKKIPTKVIFTPRTHANFTEEDLAVQSIRYAPPQDILAKQDPEEEQDWADMKMYTVGLIATVLFVAIIQRH